MSKKKIKNQQPKEERPAALKLSPKEALKRMQEFDKRKEAFLAALRKSKDRGVSP